MQIEKIAQIHTPMKEKFGIPRQSNLAPDIPGMIVFEEKYRDKNAISGLEGYDYIWLLWEFEGVASEKFRPQVRPPRLGGNEYVGVFATRSPFRPNPIGLSSVRLEKIEFDEKLGPVIYVKGADLRDGTPIIDIKPYLPYVDAHPNARGGFTDKSRDYQLKVEFAEGCFAGDICADPSTTEDLRPSVLLKPVIEQLLAQDPRPAYQDDEDRVYGMNYDGYEIKFRVANDVLKVIEIVRDNRM